MKDAIFWIIDILNGVKGNILAKVLDIRKIENRLRFQLRLAEGDIIYANCFENHYKKIKWTKDQERIQNLINTEKIFHIEPKKRPFSELYWLNITNIFEV